MWRVVVMLCTLCMASGAARAQSIVLESFTRERPRGSVELLAPLHAELSLRGYLHGDTLGRQYEARISRPAVSSGGLTPDFEDAIERGHKAWISGRFEDAVRTLTPMIEAAHVNPAAIAQNQMLLEKLQKGLTALALSHQRMGDLASAKEVFREVLRSYPDAEISRGTYGPEASKLFASVRQSAGQSGRGRLAVDVASDQAVVFINERFAKVGRTSKGDMLPGDYRVYSQIGKSTSRVHAVSVKAEHEAALQIDHAYDASLRTGPDFTGLIFDTAAARETHEAKYAARFAREMNASAVVVIGFDQVRGRPALVGALVDLRSAREIRRASLALEPAAPSTDRIRGLARFLAGEDGGAELDIEIGSSAPAPDADLPPVAAGAPSRWKRWAGVTSLVVGVIGGGLALKFALDGRDAGDELRDACAVACTSDEVNGLQGEQRSSNRRAVIAGAAGGVAVITGVVFLVLSRSSGAGDPALSGISMSGSLTDVQVSYAFSL